MSNDTGDATPGILKGLESLILEAVEIYRADDIEKVREQFPSQRLAKFRNHIASKPDERGAPLMLYWPHGVFRLGREADIINPQTLSLAWIGAASGMPDYYCRCRALWMLPISGRGFDNVVPMPRSKGPK
ncbi:hypothetical protein HNQ57_002837 [Zhongshania antarctica]|uniref:Uncharacterized protein n=1 Tax=Zhongshania antarctica TaxID=641702 RepID=A0A840R6Q9_9GAMM|nr:hypothetical protein [Zhongshania antarctica]MBB5188547.1 hypothetical protein [Zhongshania antarctica]